MKTEEAITKSKWEKVKSAIANPPPDRLASIEYKSHFLQMLGIFVVCIFLIIKGFWYIIFALIFGVGVSYSQGISAYNKFTAIQEIMGKKTIEDDPSPSRRRTRLVEQAFGWRAKVFPALTSIAICYFFIPFNTWYFKTAFAFAFILIYIIIMLFPMYWLAAWKELAK